MFSKVLKVIWPLVFLLLGVYVFFGGDIQLSLGPFQITGFVILCVLLAVAHATALFEGSKSKDPYIKSLKLSD